MAGLPSPGPADEHAPEPDSAIEDGASGDGRAGDSTAGAGDEQPPTPSLWAAALALLALLAFGVLIGSLTGSGSRGPERVLLAAAPSQSSAQAAGTTGANESGEGSAAGQTQAGEGEEGSAGQGEEGSAGEGEGGEETGEGEGEEGSAGEGEGGEETGEGEGEEGGQEAAEGGGGAPAAKEPGKAHPHGASRNAPASSSAGQQPAGAGALPPIKHVFLIVLGEEGFEESFGASAKAPYLAKRLRGQGELIDNYYAITSGELANEIALVSGQGPTTQTATDCPAYQALSPGKLGSEGQALGSGCVYPKQALTIGDQLTEAGKTWKAYVQGLGASGGCSVPTLGAADPHATPTAGSPYVTWRDPFAYFRSVTGAPSCAKHLVSLHALAADLKSAADTPSLSYIAPDPCDDGSPEACAPGQPAGIAAAEPFLRSVVPRIEASPAYRAGGLIAITFDQAPQSGPHADSSGCCMSVSYPNLAGGAPTTTTSTSLSTTTAATSSAAAGEIGTSTGTAASAQTTSATTGTATSAQTSTSATTTTTSAAAVTGSATGKPAASPGGGRVGLLLISKYVKPGSIEVVGNYDHFSLLASIEGIFRLQHPLGYAAAPGLLELGSSVYNGQP